MNYFVRHVIKVIDANIKAKFFIMLQIATVHVEIVASCKFDVLTPFFTFTAQTIQLRSIRRSARNVIFRMRLRR